MSDPQQYRPVDGYPIIRGADELNALPLGSVVLDMGGLPRQATASSNGVNEWEPGPDDRYFSTDELIVHVKSCGVLADFLVLYVEEWE